MLKLQGSGAYILSSTDGLFHYITTHQHGYIYIYIWLYIYIYIYMYIYIQAKIAR